LAEKARKQSLKHSLKKEGTWRGKGGHFIIPLSPTKKGERKREE